MASPYDLHCHSTASDGTLTPGAVVERAAAAGVRVLALTDHDTLAGLAEAAPVAAALGLTLIGGVEISVTWAARTLHIVGLGVDPACELLQQGLRGLRAQREVRAGEIGRRLVQAGFADALAGARAYARGDLVSRSHFARFLVDRGVAADVRGVFQHFLVAGKPGYVPGEWTTLEDATRWIISAGGLPVIAHPARYRFTRTRMKRLIGEFRDCGGIALEVMSGSHSRDDAFVFARHAREERLLASAGSDYHGPENPWIDLGRLPAMPEGCRPIWTWPGFPTPAEPRATADVRLAVPRLAVAC